MKNRNVRCFYVPRERVYADLDPVTGEISAQPSMTKQEFVAECDINNIIKSFSKTGQVAHISAKAAQGAYVDLPEPVDYQTALNIVADAEASFATLPSKVRDRFENDPQAFLAFMADAKNMDEARALGLLNPLPAPPKEEPSPKAE